MSHRPKNYNLHIYIYAVQYTTLISKMYNRFLNTGEYHWTYHALTEKSLGARLVYQNWCSTSTTFSLNTVDAEH